MKPEPKPDSKPEHERWWAIWKNNPATLEHRRALCEMTSDLRLRRSDLVPLYAWYRAYAEESYRSDAAFNLKLRQEKVNAFRPRKESLSQLRQKTRTARRELRTVLTFLESPAKANVSLRKNLAVEVRQLLERFHNIELAYQRNKAGIRDTWDNPNHGRRGVAGSKRKVLISVSRRTLYWWDDLIPSYRGKSADMLTLGECWSVTDAFNTRALQKLIRDAKSVVTASDTSNFFAARPPRD